MDAADDKRRSVSWYVVPIASGLVIFALVAYALAPGPVDWLCDNGYISVATHKRLGPLFYPLSVLARYCPWYRDFIEWWSELWAG
jgi:hypothetical protein